MKLVATLDIPAEDERYVCELWDCGDHVALRDYVDNQGWFDVEVEL